MSKNNSGVSRARFYDCNHEKAGLKFFTVMSRSGSSPWLIVKKVQAEKPSDVLGVAFPGKQFNVVTNRIFAEAVTGKEYSFCEC